MPRTNWVGAGRRYRRLNSGQDCAVGGGGELAAVVFFSQHWETLSITAVGKRKYSAQNSGLVIDTGKETAMKKAFITFARWNGYECNIISL